MYEIYYLLKFLHIYSKATKSVSYSTAVVNPEGSAQWIQQPGIRRHAESVSLTSQSQNLFPYDSS
jgi:hypothetical protein